MFSTLANIYGAHRPTVACNVTSSGTPTGTHLLCGISRMQCTLKLALMYPLSDTTCIHAHMFHAGALSTSDALLHSDTFACTKGPTYGCHPLHHTHAHPV